MLDVIRWYLVIQLMGLAALPLAARAFRGLPDRGYAFARPVGMLAVTVALWLGCIFGLWSNSGAMVAVLTVALAAGGWLGLRSAVADVQAVWQTRRRHVLVIEGIFVAALVFWAVARAYFPTIEATEKPMEFGFLSAILRSSRFPPVDMWLSGNSISYYYLGYVLVAAVTEVSAVTPAVAFNLAIATLFALTVTGAFALGCALVEGLRVTRLAARGEKASEELVRQRPGPTWVGGALAAWFVALLGNWEGFFELLHAHGVGSADFWKSLAIWHLTYPPLNSPVWFPTDALDNWWWFRASRVILDYPLGQPPPDGYNTITEFPFFSFLLGDLHPHLLALPFAFVCLAFALSFLKARETLDLEHLGAHLFDLGFVAFLFGAMFLLNAWDILTYLFVLVCAFAIRSFLARHSFDLRWLRDTASFGIIALAASLFAYWPFYVTFRSQATGLLGLVDLHSHLSYFLIFWGPELFLAGSLLVAELAFGVSPFGRALSDAGPAWTRQPFLWVGVVAVAAACWALKAPALSVLVPILVGSLVLVLRYLAGTVGAAPAGQRGSATPRLAEPAVAGREDGQPVEVAGGSAPVSWAAEHTFVLTLLFVAALLLVGTELVFIKDSFGNRMNTVFKLYFQAWEMLGVVGAYAVFALGSGALSAEPLQAAANRVRGAAADVSAGFRQSLPRPAALGWLAVVAVLVAGAFVYVPAALEARSNGFTNPATLNGLAYFSQYQPDDAAGIAWLNRNVTGSPTILQATGGSYSAFDEAAWMTGLPTVLGWDFHEVQWRGASIVSDEDVRKHDIDTIYRTTDPKVAQDLMAKYNVQYVYIGPEERQVYGNDAAGLAKFAQIMDVAYKNNGVTIYRSRGAT
jgi:YYY domain-containing protein